MYTLVRSPAHRCVRGVKMQIGFVKLYLRMKKRSIDAAAALMGKRVRRQLNNILCIIHIIEEHIDLGSLDLEFRLVPIFLLLSNSIILSFLLMLNHPQLLVLSLFPSLCITIFPLLSSALESQ